MMRDQNASLPIHLRGSKQRAQATKFLLCVVLLAAVWLWSVSVQADDSPLNHAWSSDESDNTTSVAWGDYDGDGDLDLAVGSGDSLGQPNRLYRNDNGILTASAVWTSSESEFTRGVAWGDYDGDGDLDLIVANYGQPNRLYCNELGALTTSACWSSSEPDLSTSVAWGDMDGDADLDLAVGNYGQPNRLYRNDGGVLTSSAVWASEESDPTTSIAWGNYNDGDDLDLDLAVGNSGQPNRLYCNQAGLPIASACWNSIESDLSSSVAWGDVDGDGDLDLAVGNGLNLSDQPNRLYCNEDGVLGESACWSSAESEPTHTVAWADYDSDGDPDLAVGDGGGIRLYCNEDGVLTEGACWTSPWIVDWFASIAWGDCDGDGDLDLAVGVRTSVASLGSPNRLYRNDLGIRTVSPDWISLESEYTTDVAWGDYDGDGDLDLSAANHQRANRLYCNEDGALIETACWSSSESERTQSVAWADYDNDGDLDLAAGNDDQPNRLYCNEDGVLTESACWRSAESDYTNSAVWGDYDGDGDLDLAVANGRWEQSQPNRLYCNEGGMLNEGACWTSAESDWSQSVAWGDYDGDGDLDLAVGNHGRANRLYRSDSGMLTTNAVWNSAESDLTNSVAWGDYDGDGDLDLAVGNGEQANRLYCNDGGVLSESACWSSIEADPTASVVWSDYDGDGDLDLLAVGWGYIRMYVNSHGRLTDRAVWTIDEGWGAGRATSAAWGDYDGDGDLDLALGDIEHNKLYPGVRDAQQGPAPIPIVQISRPEPPPSADFYSTPNILPGPDVLLTYKLFHPESLPVQHLNAYYSLNGGGEWLPAVAASGTVTTNLSTSPDGTVHTYTWDVFRSGLMGRYDNVVFRLQAVPTIVNQPNQIPGPYLYGSYAFSTFPFRVRGTQVRVMQETESGTAPVHNALVYRLPADENWGGSLLADAKGTPFHTDGQGYLQGRSEIYPDDRLLALAPVDWSETLTWAAGLTATLRLYHTNGIPTDDGVEAFTVTEPGVQVLTVSEEHPLLLANLDVSLEWDAHNEPLYLEQLADDLQRTSEFLYDFSDGQVALGEVTVHQNGDLGASSHVAVYASNRLRPLAIQGGIVVTETVDPGNGDIVYNLGQVRMGANWNRYGDPGYDLAQDWPLALAHELSHFLLFLDDVYLGLDENDLLIPIDTCVGSAMGHLYDPDSSEFIFDTDFWDDNCGNTLANVTLGRTEWETIQMWYPPLVSPSTLNRGPGLMPFDFTTVQIRDPITPTDVLADPNFYVHYVGGGEGSAEARGYVMREGNVVDLGTLMGGQNELLARGAQLSDRLCVFDPGRHQYGCEIIEELGDDELDLEEDPTWTPQLQLTPVNSRTFEIEVAGLASGLALQAQLHPEYGAASDVLTLAEDGAVYTATFHLPEPALMGHVQLWVDEDQSESNPRREAMVAYAVGGNAGRYPFQRATGPFQRATGAPISSPDGQMIYYALDPAPFEEGELYMIQSMASLPLLPVGKTALGQGYSLVASPQASTELTGSISFQYLGTDALVADVDEDELTIHHWDGSHWLALHTIRDTYYNMASAPSRGTGVYALLAGVTVPDVASVAPVAATNDQTTMLTISGGYFLEPLEVALLDPHTDSSYVLPHSLVSTDLITAVVPEGLAPAEYQVVVRNLNEPGGPAVSPVPGTFALYRPLVGARFYDYFESGSGKWELDGDWAITVLPDGEWAMTDSPAGNYDNAIPGDGTLTTSITSQPFSLTGCLSPTLTFRHDYVIAMLGSSQDWGRVEISTDNGVTWDVLATYSGGGIYDDLDQRVEQLESEEWTDVSWEWVEIDLSEYTGTVRLRFVLEVDETVSDKGWVIDDVVIKPWSETYLIHLPLILKSGP